MNIKVWIAIGVAGFAIGAGVNGLQIALDDGGESTPGNVAASNNGGRFPTDLGNGEFQIPEDGEFELPEGPVTLPDGTIIDRSGGEVTMPDGSVIEVPARPGAGSGSGRGGPILAPTPTP